MKLPEGIICLINDGQIVHFWGWVVALYIYVYMSVSQVSHETHMCFREDRPPLVLMGWWEGGALKRLCAVSNPPTHQRVKVSSALSLLLLSVAQSCPTLCEPMACSPPGSSVQGISPGKNTGSRQPFPSPGGLPHSETEPTSPALAGGFFPTEPPGKPAPL